LLHCSKLALEKPFWFFLVHFLCKCSHGHATGFGTNFQPLIEAKCRFMNFQCFWILIIVVFCILIKFWSLINFWILINFRILSISFWISTIYGFDSFLDFYPSIDFDPFYGFDPFHIFWSISWMLIYFNVWSILWIWLISWILIHFMDFDPFHGFRSILWILNHFIDFDRSLNFVVWILIHCWNMIHSIS